jgi:hypothetical protein
VDDLHFNIFGHYDFNFYLFLLEDETPLETKYQKKEISYEEFKKIEIVDV